MKNTHFHIYTYLLILFLIGIAPFPIPSQTQYRQLIQPKYPTNRRFCFWTWCARLCPNPTDVKDNSVIIKNIFKSYILILIVAI